MKEPVRDSIALERLQSEFGVEQSDELIELFCSGVGDELAKIKTAAEGENLQRLLHNSRGLRGVCQSVFVTDMQQTCLEIESAGGQSNWPLVDTLIKRLESQFERLRRQYQVAT